MDRVDAQDASATALRCGGEVLGFVSNEEPGDRVSGLFVPGPDFERYRPLFDHAFALQRRVDGLSEADYQGAWHEWDQAIGAIEALGLVYGLDTMPVEDFEIDDRWRVSFGPPLWWTVGSEGDSDA